MTYIVVFDTNVLLSALLSTKGSPFRCLALAKIGKVQSVTCPEILAEFSEKLRDKFRFSEAEIQKAVAEVKSFSTIIEITGTLRVIAADPDDDMVVECAVTAQATHIVTGDKHLLALIQYQNIAILKAADFVALLSSG